MQSEGAASSTIAKSSQDEKTFTTPTIILLVTVMLCMFLVVMDRVIIATAIPQISDDFGSVSDVGWYGGAYNLTCCAFQLLFGKLYAFFPVKVVLIASVLLFEAASALCGAAPTSLAFLIGRAFAGVGAAGIFAGTIMCVVHTVPLAKRPMVQGMMGSIGGVGTVIAPLIGGALTSHASWRWCFYINLPPGGVGIAAIYFCLKAPERSRETKDLSLTKKLAQIDFPGSACLLPGVVCLLLALQWGGQTYSWGNGRIVALLTLQGILFIGFALAQVFLPKTATLPPSLFKHRTVTAAFWSTFFTGSTQYMTIYYLPIWFQAIKGVSAVDSGIRLLPLFLTFVIASITGGIINQKIGYYNVLGVTGVCLMCIGAGLLTTLQVNSSAGKWIGYQVIYGLGQGYCFQTPNLAVQQTVLPKPQVPMGMALMFFGQLLGASIFVAVGENVLGGQLLQRLRNIPGFSSSSITSGGVTSLLNGIPVDLRPEALVQYNEALRKVLQISLILSCLSALGIFSLEWKSTLKKPAPNAQPEKGSVAENPVEAQHKSAA
ncbi:major facilitator superfamily domain-containing protein [Lophiotrema nucula]|uniref:Major facilitator superfamily domain-containing protein n=1 Tax=Lophiotrema nucula TaxID=690887 RepID=A0A6A5ZK56_9PLEO|nr:major facilitator superfamily domain-containing protein [Lophiotrema nucula]